MQEGGGYYGAKESRRFLGAGRYNLEQNEFSKLTLTAFRKSPLSPDSSAKGPVT